jgi:peptide/nickel transport system substrate-binding protein
VENAVLDDWLHGEMSRAQFMRRASVLGLSLTAVGGLLGCGGGSSTKSATATTTSGTTPAGGVKMGGRLRLGIIPPPAAAIEPIAFADNGSLDTGSINGEFLTRARQDLSLGPELATSWKPNRDASAWTFKLRPNVKFQNGKVLGADDVVATYKRLVDPKSGSQALSAFKGVLSPGGVRKVDDLTVQFVLDNPTASFPYLTCQTTYQAIILPADYKMGTYVSTPQTTGAFILRSYTPGVGAKYDRNPDWWGGKAPLDGIDAKYYDDDAALDAAVLGGQVDLASQVSFIAGGQSLVNNPNVQTFPAKGAAHREICMRVDRAPLNDARVRRAIALSLNRPDQIKTLLGGFGDLGNDSPFAPAYPSTDKSVAQRERDLTEAKQLLAAAGASNLRVELTTHKAVELPQLAQVFQASAKAIGIDVALNVESTQTYYGGKASGGPDGFGTTPWLNAPLTATDWGHRPVPDVFITSDFMSTGVWNASRYSSKAFDRAARGYLGSLSLQDQRRYAGQMEKMLLDDTPVIIPYFVEYLAAGSKKVHGYEADAEASVYLSKTWLA